MTSPIQPEPSPSPPTWWHRNRLALALLLPLAALAALASSYPLFTLYRPSHFSRAQRGVGSTVHFHETFGDEGFGKTKTWQRDVTITLGPLKSNPVIGDERAARGATLWLVTLEMQAKPDVPLRECQVMLLDTEGRLYNTTAGKYMTKNRRIRGLPVNSGCTPFDAPGPSVIFGDLLAAEGTRPPSWTFQRTVAMPQGRQPQAVRVAWQRPNYAEIRVPSTSR